MARRDGRDLAVAGSIDRDASEGAYAAVFDDGSALIGAFSATDVQHQAAVMVGLDLALARFGNRASVTVALRDQALRQLLRHPAFPYRRSWPRSCTPALLYRRSLFRVQRHLRRLDVSIPDPDHCAGNGHVPDHPLLGPAVRLAWYTVQLNRECADLDANALTWLGQSAGVGNKVERLRRLYDRRPLQQQGHLNGATSKVLTDEP